MPGTLLVYDASFPRARVPDGPILNTPGDAELRANSYPQPYRLLPIREGATPDDYFPAIAQAAAEMGRLDRFIIFGHGRVVRAASAGGVTPVTTGIIIGASDITADNARRLRPLRGRFRSGAQAELWVCNAAAAGTAGGLSGRLLCQAIANALRVTLYAPGEEQRYGTVDQVPRPGGGWQSTVQFLPWDGPLVRFRPTP